MDTLGAVGSVWHPAPIFYPLPTILPHSGRIQRSGRLAARQQVKKVDSILRERKIAVLPNLCSSTGRDRQLYEVVIFTTEKNEVTGYLSTPKSSNIVVAGD